MKAAANARILSGTVVELADFAQAHGYKLQSDRRGYITLVPITSSTYRKTQPENVVQFRRN